MRLRLLATFFVLFFLATSTYAEELEDRVLAPSVRITTGAESVVYLGSGTIFQVDKLWYVVTAGHTLEDVRKLVEIEVTNDKGSVEKKKKVVWPDIFVTRPIYKDKRDVGEVRIRSTVAAYSASEEKGGVDIAVLEIPETDSFKFGARWGDSDKLKMSQDVVHVGNLYGNITQAFCRGSIARLDLHLPELNARFVVTPMNGARPGSSGGGVFIQVGNEYMFVGMITRGDRGGLTLTKPANQIADFLKESKLESITKAK